MTVIEFYARTGRMSWTSISAAYAYWLSHRDSLDPPERVEEAETFILSQRPKDNEEAACILDVIATNNGDSRSDGLDRVALNRVRRYLAR